MAMTIEEIAQVLGGGDTDLSGRRSFYAVGKGTVRAAMYVSVCSWAAER